jgi:uncharacterized protein (DUF2132 family)
MCMARIVGTAEEVKQFVSRLEPIFIQPWSEHFERLVTGLIVSGSGNCTIEAMTKDFVGHPHPSSANRFLTDAPWPEEQVRAERIRFAYEQYQRHTGGESALVIDSKIEEHNGKGIFGVGKYWDHVRGAYVWGQLWFSSTFAWSRGDFPVGYRLYQKKEPQTKEGIPQNEKEVDFQTGLELAEQLVDEADRHGLAYGVVLLDSWFFQPELASALVQRGKHFVMGARNNLVVFCHGQPRKLSEFVNSIPWEAFREAEVDGKGYRVFSKAIRFQAFGKEKLRLLIAFPLDTKREAVEPILLVTDNLQWEAVKILRLSQWRWRIETFYHEANQHLGWGESELRDEDAVRRFKELVCVAYTLLRQPGRSRLLGGRWQSALQSVGSNIRRITRNLFEQLVNWVIDRHREDRLVPEIVAMAYASRSDLAFTFA